MKKKNDSQEGKNLTAHRQEFPCLVKILEHNSFPLHTVKPVQRFAVTWVAFEWGSELLPLPCWDILQLHPMLRHGHAFIFISLFPGDRHLWTAMATAAELVLSTCPKCVLLKLPAFANAVAGGACSSFGDTARQILGVWHHVLLLLFLEVLR